MYYRQRTMRVGRRMGVGRTDWLLILIVAALTTIGLIAVANATIDPYAVAEGKGIFKVLSRLTTNSFYWQLTWVGVGLVAIFLIGLFDYRIYGELAPYVFGAALLLLADVGSRIIMPPVVLPIGALTSFLGGPMFLYLCLKGGKRK